MYRSVTRGFAWGGLRRRYVCAGLAAALGVAMGAASFAPAAFAADEPAAEAPTEEGTGAGQPADGGAESAPETGDAPATGTGADGAQGTEGAPGETVQQPEAQQIVASITKDGQTTPYTTLGEAATAAQSGDTIKLLADAKIESGVKVELKLGVSLEGVRKPDGKMPRISGSLLQVDGGADSSSPVTVSGVSFVLDESYTNTNINGAASSIWIYGSNVKVKGCEFHAVSASRLGFGTAQWKASIYCYKMNGKEPGVRNISVYGNTFDSEAGASPTTGNASRYYAVYVTGENTASSCGGISVVKNTLTGPGKLLRAFDTETKTAGLSSVTIKANEVLNHEGTQDRSGSVCVSLAGTWGVTVSGNTFEGMRGIQTDNGGSGLRRYESINRVSVTGNTFKTDVAVFDSKSMLRNNKASIVFGSDGTDDNSYLAGPSEAKAIPFGGNGTAFADSATEDTYKGPSRTYGALFYAVPDGEDGSSYTDAAVYTTWQAVNRADGVDAPAEETARKGYKFVGWYYLDAKGEEKGASFGTADAQSTSTSGRVSEKDFGKKGVIRYYAKWNKVVSLTFEENGGSVVEDQAKEMTSPEGVTFTEPAAPTRDGYVFEGWYADGDLTDEFDFTGSYTEDQVAYAKWKKVEEPVGPDQPDKPDKPDQPDTPDPDEPDNPDTPDPDEPDNPDTPDPDEPDNPDTPDPDEPDQPDTPDTPDTPDEPSKPETPSKPSASDGGTTAKPEDGSRLPQTGDATLPAPAIAAVAAAGAALIGGGAVLIKRRNGR